jgi:hypothetical protein
VTKQARQGAAAEAMWGNRPLAGISSKILEIHRVETAASKKGEWGKTNGEQQERTLLDVSKKKDREQGEKNSGEQERAAQPLSEKQGQPKAPTILPLTAENLLAKEGNFVDNEPTSELNRQIGDMTRTIIQGMRFAEAEESE